MVNCFLAVCLSFRGAMEFGSVISGLLVLLDNNDSLISDHSRNFIPLVLCRNGLVE